MTYFQGFLEFVNWSDLKILLRNAFFRLLLYAIILASVGLAFLMWRAEFTEATPTVNTVNWTMDTITNSTNTTFVPYLLGTECSSKNFSYWETSRKNFISYFPMAINITDGNFTDITGNFNGTCIATGCPIFNQNKYFTFDGINDYINLSRKLNFNGTNITILMWIYPIENGTDQVKTLISQYNSFSAFGRDFTFQYVVNTNQQVVQFNFYNGSTTTRSVISIINNRINLNQWYQVGFQVYNLNSSTGNITVIVNGSIVASGLYNITKILHNSSDLYIGQVQASSTSPDQFFNGSIKDFMVFNYTLNPSEINELYNATLQNRSVRFFPNNGINNEIITNNYFCSNLTAYSNIIRKNATLSSCIEHYVTEISNWQNLSACDLYDHVYQSQFINFGDKNGCGYNTSYTIQQNNSCSFCQNHTSNLSICAKDLNISVNNIYEEMTPIALFILYGIFLALGYYMMITANFWAGYGLWLMSIFFDIHFYFILVAEAVNEYDFIANGFIILIFFKFLSLFFLKSKVKA